MKRDDFFFKNSFWKVLTLIYLKCTEFKYSFIYFFQLSGQVTKKLVNSDRPKQARPETEAENRFGHLQMVQKVHRLKDEKPKTTNPWDLTEIPCNVLNKNPIR